jgi:GTPase SAR1 family protein
MILIFDMSLMQSFTGLEAWLSKLTNEMGVKCPIIICGNKIDLPNALPKATVKEWAEEHGATAHFTSAVDGTGITELFQIVATKVSNAPKENSFGGTPILEQAQKKKCC